MKRTFSILLCALLLIPVFAVCASALTVYNFEWQYSEILGDTGYNFKGFLPAGSYYLTITDGDLSMVSKEPFTLQYNADGIMEVEMEIVMVSFPIETNFVCGVISDGREALLALPDQRDGFSIYLSPASTQDNAIPSVSDTLDICIDWVGTVTTSLFSGELNGLLLLAAIPIAITVVMLSIKFIRRNSWGC